MLRIDSHHHLWRYVPQDFGWLGGELACLRRDFLPDDLAVELRRAGVGATVAVQARQSVEETDWLLETARRHRWIAGVVGWLPLRDDLFGSYLAKYREAPALKGLRHVVQAEADGFLDDSRFRKGFSLLAETGLVYELLILERQLPEAIRLVDAFPRQQFVLDHAAKPLIGRGEMQPWARRIVEVAERPNVICKVSGMVTEAGTGWDADDLRRYYLTILDAFGPARMMAGSDWPVLEAHIRYAEWWRLIERWAQALTADEQAALLGGTALRTYGLRLQETDAQPEEQPGEQA